jgi:sulfate transport system permease protein
VSLTRSVTARPGGGGGGGGRPPPRRARRRWVPVKAGRGLTRGVVLVYLSVMVLLPLAAVVVKSTSEGTEVFWNAVSNPQAVDALVLTLIASLIVAAINAVFGTLIAWVLVRDQFPGKGIVNAVIDLPFALPTIVAGLVLLSLYGPNSPFGINVAFTKWAILLALLFVTLPFVVRAVQPVLMEMDKEVEEAAASLGASRPTVFLRILLPALIPAILAGSALAFARAIGEFGSVVLISGNLPRDTEVASVFIFGQIESGNITGAAAVSVVLLLLSMVVLATLAIIARWRTRHDA